VLDASTSSLRYGLTDANGVSALDLARAASGPGYDALERVLVELVSGRTDHVGSLLAPFGVRFVVAGDGDLPPAVRLRLDNQLDLDRVPALGLRIYRDPRPFPEASSVGADTLAPFLSATTEPTSATGDLTSLSMLRTERVSPLTRAPGGWTGRGPGRAGSVFVSQQLAAGWRLRVGGATREPVTAFGWGIGFGGVRGGKLRVDYSRQWIRTWEVVVLALVWMAALWITRKPVAS
jgi:hypothetical protein